MEKQLLKKLRSRNQRAQRAVYDAHCDRLMSIIMRYLHSIPDAEEALQDTFIKVFDKIVLYDVTRGSFENWTHRIAVNQALMQLRKMKSSKFQFCDLKETERMISNQGLENLNYEDLLNIIKRLDPRQQALINLRLVEGFEFDEIADLLNLSLSNSRKILSRARTALVRDIKSSDEAV